MAKDTPKVPPKLAAAAEQEFGSVPKDPSCEQGTCGAADAPGVMGSYPGGRRSASEVYAMREPSPREKRARSLDAMLSDLAWRQSNLRSTEARCADLRESIATLEGEIALLRYKLATE